MLNDSLKFDSLAPDVKLAFSGHATKEIFFENTLLFRFSDHDAFSPWWCEVTHLRHLLLSSLVSHKPLSTLIRENFAVLRRFNQMQNLIIIKLNTKVYGFKGLVQPQNEAAIYMNKESEKFKKKFTKPVNFKGGSSQLYIPGLTKINTTSIVPLGAVNIYDEVKDILNLLIDYKII